MKQYIPYSLTCDLLSRKYKTKTNLNGVLGVDAIRLQPISSSHALLFLQKVVELLGRECVAQRDDGKLNGARHLLGRGVLFCVIFEE